MVATVGFLMIIAIVFLLLKVQRTNDSAICEAYGWPKDVSEMEKGLKT